MMTDKHKISCPACEYERNSHGQPVRHNGEMQCLDCGSTWREFGTSLVAAQEMPKSEQPKAPLDNLKSGFSSKPRIAENPIFNQAKRSYKPGLGTMMSCLGAALLFAGVYVTMLFLQTEHPQQIRDNLYISEVQIEEQVRRNGEKVFTVKGLVANPTALSKTIPPIAIILRKQNGNEITRWYYNSSLASLQAGGKSRFATSIQYDTPIVATAEAVFK